MKIELYVSFMLFSYMDSNSSYSLGTLSVNSFTCYGVMVKTKNSRSISFSIQYDAKNQFYFIDGWEFGVFSSSDKKESLLRELKLSLEYAWAAIALEKNENLSTEQVKIKKNLLRVFKSYEN